MFGRKRCAIIQSEALVASFPANRLYIFRALDASTISRENKVIPNVCAKLEKRRRTIGILYSSLKNIIIPWAKRPNKKHITSKFI